MKAELAKRNLRRQYRSCRGIGTSDDEIYYKAIFSTPHAEALVNTVNTVGVMGKGIALMFKEAFPGNFRAYEDACKHKEVKIGKMFVTENRAFSRPALDYQFSH